MGQGGAVKGCVRGETRARRRKDRDHIRYRWPAVHADLRAPAPRLARGDLPEAVLFACTQNSVRSPMAEALLKHVRGHRIYVDSVGVRGRELDPFVIEVMDEIGIDLSRHRPKSFDNLEDTS